MSDNTPRYDVTTESYIPSGNLIEDFIHGGSRVTTLRDNHTGKTYVARDKTDQGSRDAAFDKAKRDR